MQDKRAYGLSVHGISVSEGCVPCSVHGFNGGDFSDMKLFETPPDKFLVVDNHNQYSANTYKNTCVTFAGYIVIHTFSVSAMLSF